jgi:PAS domain S-box-containing protein
MLYAHPSRVGENGAVPAEQMVDAPPGALQYVASFDIGGRHWSLTLVPAPGRYSVATSAQAWRLLIGALAVTLLLVAFVEMTRRRTLALSEATEELQESGQQFRALSMAAQDAIIMLDDVGAIVSWNEAASRMFGYTVEEALGQKIHLLLVPVQHQDVYWTGWQQFVKDGEWPLTGKVLELSAKRKDGNEFPIELSVSAVKLRGHWHAVSVVRDITVRWRGPSGR